MTGVESSGLVGLAHGGTAHVAGHLLEHPADRRWELRCGHCLALVATVEQPPDLRPRAGLVVDGAVGLPAVAGWPEVSLAWGLVPQDCEPRPPARVPAARRRPAPARAVFRTGLRRVAAEPVLLPGGLWVAVAAGRARSVTTTAFGVRNRARVRGTGRPACR